MILNALHLCFRFLQLCLLLLHLLANLQLLFELSGLLGLELLHLLLCLLKLTLQPEVLFFCLVQVLVGDLLQATIHFCQLYLLLSYSNLELLDFKLELLDLLAILDVSPLLLVSLLELLLQARFLGLVFVYLLENHV